MGECRKEEKLVRLFRDKPCYYLHGKILTYEQLNTQKIYLPGFSGETEPIGEEIEIEIYYSYISILIYEECILFYVLYEKLVM